MRPASIRRATGLRIPGVGRGAWVRLRFDEQDVYAFEGEMLASALLAAGIRALRRSPTDGGPRGLYCAMGSCQECVVQLDGRRVEACRVTVVAGMEVKSIP